MARAYLLLGELERASGYAQAAIELQPTISTAYALSGQIAFSLRDPETAKAYLQQAIKIGNNDVAIREVFAYVLLDLGESPQAIEQFQLVLQVSPNRISSITGVAIATAKQGDIEEAMRMLADARNVYPNDPRIERAIQLISQMRNSP